MTTTFETAKVGDKVWSIEYGWGEIQSLTEMETYPVKVVFPMEQPQSYTRRGHRLLTHARRTLFWDEVVIEAPIKPMPVLKVDAKVFVCGIGCDQWLKRHFSHFEKGVIHTFDDGHTSWTGGPTTAWENWEVAAV